MSSRPISASGRERLPWLQVSSKWPPEASPPFSARTASKPPKLPLVSASHSTVSLLVCSRPRSRFQPFIFAIHSTPAPATPPRPPHVLFRPHPPSPPPPPHPPTHTPPPPRPSPP